MINMPSPKISEAVSLPKEFANSRNTMQHNKKSRPMKSAIRPSRNNRIK